MDELITRIEALERENALLRARAEIENLAAKYQDLTLSCQGMRILSELWSHQPDIRLEYAHSGVYAGHERVCFYYDKAPAAGRFEVYQLTTPHIEISPDGISARGVWGVIGAESNAGDLGNVPPKTSVERALLSSEDGLGRRYRAEWLWQRLEMMLRIENGEWRIYSLHIHELFRCPFDQSWVEWALERQKTDGLRTDAYFTPASVPEEEQRPPEFNASFATTEHWQYAPDAMPPKGLL